MSIWWCFLYRALPKLSKWFGGLWLTKTLNRPSEDLTGLLAQYMGPVEAWGRGGCTVLITAGRGGLILDWNNSFIYIIAVPSDCAAGPQRLQDSLLVNTSSGWVFRAVWVKDSLNVNCLNNETWNTSTIPLRTSFWFFFFNDDYYQPKRFFLTFFKR